MVSRLLSASHPRDRSARWQKAFFFPFVRNSRPGGGVQIAIFSLSRLTPPLDETLLPHRGWEKRQIFQCQCGPRATTCGPRAATQVRPASRAGRTSQFRGPQYNAHFWTLGGPHFMASRATFGPRATLFTPLGYRHSLPYSFVFLLLFYNNYMSGR